MGNGVDDSEETGFGELRPGRYHRREIGKASIGFDGNVNFERPDEVIFVDRSNGTALGSDCCNGYDSGDWNCVCDNMLRRCNGFGACFDQRGKSKEELQGCESKGSTWYCPFMADGRGKDGGKRGFVDPKPKSFLDEKDCPKPCQPGQCKAGKPKPHIQAKQFDAVYVVGDSICASICDKFTCKQTMGDGYCREAGCKGHTNGCHTPDDYYPANCDDCKVLFPNACGSSSGGKGKSSQAAPSTPPDGNAEEKNKGNKDEEKKKQGKEKQVEGKGDPNDNKGSKDKTKKEGDKTKDKEGDKKKDKDKDKDNKKDKDKGTNKDKDKDKKKDKKGDNDQDKGDRRRRRK